MISLKDIGWIAGLLEGEGSFQYEHSPRIMLVMTDEDVIRKAASIFKVSYNKYESNLGYKTSYRLTVNGQVAIEWMFTIYSLMGKRRQLKILEMINYWKTKKRIRGTKDTFPCGHPRISSNFTAIRNCRTCVNKRNKEYYELKRKLAYENSTEIKEW